MVLANVSVQAKKMTDLTSTTTVSDDDIVLVHNDSGMNQMNFGDFKKAINADVSAGVATGTCSTAAATAAKVVDTTSNWTLEAGATIIVKFSNTNTASNPTINVNGTGAKSIWYGGDKLSTEYLNKAGYANYYEMYVYDGTRYVWLAWSYDDGSDNAFKVSSNAGAHNSIYRGEYLGTSVTTAQYNAISAGTFDDLFIGDYWTINSVNWRIAAFDYYFNRGDTWCTTHHAVIVPDTILYTAKMNDTSITTGGYVGSVMYTTNLEDAKTTINSAFSGHVLSHRNYLSNAVTNGYTSGGTWKDSTVELMTERMVYGNPCFAPMGDGSTTPSQYSLDYIQLPLFALDTSRITALYNGNKYIWWLRDVVTASGFAGVANHGGCDFGTASYASGVRPAFLIS